MQIFLYVLMML